MFNEHPKKSGPYLTQDNHKPRVKKIFVRTQGPKNNTEEGGSFSGGPNDKRVSEGVEGIESWAGSGKGKKKVGERVEHENVPN